MAIKPTIPDIQGLQDPKAMDILKSIKLVIDGVTGRSPTLPKIKTLGSNPNFYGVTAKINEIVNRLQSDPDTAPPGGTNNQGAATTFISSIGGVSSVALSFTGGLISVAGSPITSSGTFAQTVAGTSGGIPYFSGVATWASSGLLTQHGVLLGGGAGAAPAALGVAAANTFLAGVAASDPTFRAPVLASADFVNQGTTTTLLHGNAAGNPSWGAVAIGTEVSGLGTGVAAFLATPSSANLAAAVTGETGTGALVFADAPTFPSRVTINGAGLLSIGVLASGGGAINPGAVAEFQAANAILSLIQTTGIANEAAFMFMAPDAGAAQKKTGSISSKWDDDNATTGWGKLRFNATTDGGASSSIEMVIHGEHGIDVFNGDAASGPGDKILSIGGTVLISATAQFDSASGYGAKFTSNELITNYERNIDDEQFYIGWTGYHGGSTRYRSLTVGDGKAGLVIGTTGSTKAVSMPGAVSTGSVAATTTITATTGMACGNATPGSGGLAFPATAIAVADANTLDDYEEGAWTAAMTCGTSGTITLNAHTARYTKIGRVVIVTANISAASVSSPVGSLTVTGLPFTVLAPASGVNVRWSNLETTAITQMQGFANDGSTTIILDKFAAGVSSDMAADVKAGSNVMLNAVYFV